MGMDWMTKPHEQWTERDNADFDAACADNDAEQAAAGIAAERAVERRFAEWCAFPGDR